MITADVANVILGFGSLLLTMIMVVIMIIERKK
ncbi:putative holin-like toxin [Alteribacillus sp. YIM 98480]